MATINTRNNKLIIDFRFNGSRYREQTKLPDTAANRKRLDRVIKKLDGEIEAGTFDYETFFPNRDKKRPPTKPRINTRKISTISLTEFFELWFNENKSVWSTSHTGNTLFNMQRYILPNVGTSDVSTIHRSEILALRAEILNGSFSKKKPSNNYVNKIMATFQQVLAEASLRYEFQSPFLQIKRLKKEATEVSPFSLEEVQKMITVIRQDFRSYLITRFFTGLRTSEINGLKWKFVDFDNREIIVREGLVKDETTNLKNNSSRREINMTNTVFDALKEQHKHTGHLPYVFCNNAGKPINLTNFTNRVWKPLLLLLNIEYRQPYQTRHTAATLWLAAGEAPEYVARQMGHSSTQMLFTVYSRYVPNLTRQDGSAFENLINTRIQMPSTTAQLNDQK